MDDHVLEDRLQSAMAMSQSIQNRLMQSACKGKMSAGVAQDIIDMSDSIQRIMAAIKESVK